MFLLVVTGGCGTAYVIHIDSELFKGKRILQQHRLVNEVSGYVLYKYI